MSADAIDALARMMSESRCQGKFQRIVGWGELPQYSRAALNSRDLPARVVLTLQRQ
jgi:hypothetical protein